MLYAALACTNPESNCISLLTVDRRLRHKKTMTDVSEPDSDLDHDKMQARSAEMSEAPERIKRLKECESSLSSW